MVDVKPILRTALVAQAAALAARSHDLLRKKKKRKLGLLRAATGTIVGSSLIASEADIIGGM